MVKGIFTLCRFAPRIDILLLRLRRISRFNSKLVRILKTNLLYVQESILKESLSVTMSDLDADSPGQSPLYNNFKTFSYKGHTPIYF